MSSRERERLAARRRQEKYERHLAAVRARQQHRRQVAGAVFAVAVVLVGVAFAVNLLGDDDVVDPAAASATQDPGATTPAEPTQTYTLPDPGFAGNRTWTGTLTTDVGAIGIELDGAAAPQAVSSFLSLAQQGYFDGTSCHRLVTGGIKVLQCGDPDGTGFGGPGYTFGPVENAPADDVYPAGTIAMARAADDGGSMGSQFFLVYEDSTIPADSAGGYTVMGRVTSGLDVVTAVADAGVQGGGSDGPPVTGVTIQGVETQ